MKSTTALFVLCGLICASTARAQKAAEKPAAPAVAQKTPERPPVPPAQPAGDLASGLAQRLGQELHVKTVVGQPIKAGTVTLIPILAVEVNFSGGAVAVAPGVEGFVMSGEARPVGFVAITKKGTRFIAAGAPAAK